MSESIYFVSEASVRHLKKIAARRVSGVSSSHMSEGIAASLGFRTHAALCAALNGQRTAPAQKPSNARLGTRLRQLGYSNVPTPLQVLPELDRSYSPWRQDPLRKRRGVRWRAWRNLLVGAINAGVEQGVFGLSPGEDWWGTPNAHGERRGGRYRFTFDGRMPALVSVHAISGDELSIHVVLNPKHDRVAPDCFDGFGDGDAHAQCWLERRLGIWIQDAMTGFSCRRLLLPEVASVMIEPNGYADLGSFIM